MGLAEIGFERHCFNRIFANEVEGEFTVNANVANLQFNQHFQRHPANVLV